MPELDAAQHLHPHAAAAFADGTLDPAEHAAAAAHLAGCRECRDELAEVSLILRSRHPARRPWLIAASGAAAAAVLLLVALPSTRHPSEDQHRDAALTTTTAPQPIAPVGTVGRAASMGWSAVPGAIRYRLTVFTAEGDVVWQASPADTTVVVPDSVALEPGAQYYWQIKAETGHGRWVESELVPFIVRPEAVRP